MIAIKTRLVLVFLLILIDLHQCARTGGGGRRGGGYPRYTTRRPYTTARTTHRPYSSTYRPPDQNSGNSYRPSTTRRPTTPRNNYQSTGSSYPVGSGNNNIGWNVPPRPGSTYTSGYQGPQKIKIVNKYNYHYPGYYSVPIQNPGHPGYFYTPSSYHYGAGDTGSTALGFFLGYSLAKLTTPTYSHYSFYDGYRPRYDHYTVHHYYHDKESVPPKQEIQANTIVGCVGDSVTICPANTTSLCTSNGALMCVVSATSTVPCTDNRQINCVMSTIACVNNTAPECKNSQNSTTISIPCISNAQLEGEVKYVNNTIVGANTTSSDNSTIGSNISNSITAAPIIVTDNNTSTITTLDSLTTTPGSVRKKRDTAQNFCVTIVALPAKRKETQGENFLKDAKSVVENFIESVWQL